MTHTHDYIAIDIAKASLELKTDQREVSLGNHLKGYKTLGGIANKLENPFVVLEATGGYERGVMEYLHKHNIAVARVNPGLIRHYIRSEGLKAKTDKIDAAMILRYAKSKKLRATPPPHPVRQIVAALMDRRSQVRDELKREKQRLQNSPQSIHRFIKKTIKFHEKQIDQIEAEIRSSVAADKELNKQTKLFKTVCGVGDITAWSLLAYLEELGQLKRNEIAAMAGLAPFNDDSGTHTGKRRIQGGRKKVRNALYMAANNARRFNPVIKAQYERLKAKEKPYKCNMVACMRKLLIHLHFITKNYLLTASV